MEKTATRYHDWNASNLFYEIGNLFINCKSQTV
jgi:hypothetical protein